MARSTRASRSASGSCPKEQGGVVPDERSALLTGLCANCCRGEDCSLRRDRPAPVIQCEEYDIERPPTYKRRATRVRETATFVEAGETRKGLCANCEGWATCSFPKSEAGIWHCQEYR
jgi:hypothetical protein